MKNFKMSDTMLKMASQQDIYGPPPEEFSNIRNAITEQNEVYGPASEPRNNSNNHAWNGVNIGIIIVLFILGIFALVNKKLSKISKIIILSAIILIGIIATVIIKKIT